jgi:hypothetical protein
MSEMIVGEFSLDGSDRCYNPTIPVFGARIEARRPLWNNSDFAKGQLLLLGPFRRSQKRIIPICMRVFDYRNEMLRYVQ